MITVLPSCMDLLFQNLDLAFILLSGKNILLLLFLQLFKSCIQSLQFLFQTLIFYLGLFIRLFCLRKLFLCSF